MAVTLLTAPAGLSCILNGAGGKSRISLEILKQFDFSQFVAPHEMGTTMINPVMLKQSNW